MSVDPLTSDLENLARPATDEAGKSAEPAAKAGEELSKAEWDKQKQQLDQERANARKAREAAEAAEAKAEESQATLESTQEELAELARQLEAAQNAAPATDEDYVDPVAKREIAILKKAVGAAQKKADAAEKATTELRESQERQRRDDDADRTELAELQTLCEKLGTTHGEQWRTAAIADAKAWIGEHGYTPENLTGGRAEFQRLVKARLEASWIGVKAKGESAGQSKSGKSQGLTPASDTSAIAAPDGKNSFDSIEEAAAAHGWSTNLSD